MARVFAINKKTKSASRKRYTVLRRVKSFTKKRTSYTRVRKPRDVWSYRNMQS